MLILARRTLLQTVSLQNPVTEALAPSPKTAMWLTADDAEIIRVWIPVVIDLRYPLGPFSTTVVLYRNHDELA